MKNKQKSCPQCSQPVKKAGGAYPFCSERCRLLDFNSWTRGCYSIPAVLCEEIETEEAGTAALEETEGS